MNRRRASRAGRFPAQERQAEAIRTFFLRPGMGGMVCGDAVNGAVDVLPKVVHILFACQPRPHISDKDPAPLRQRLSKRDGAGSPRR